MHICMICIEKYVNKTCTDSREDVSVYLHHRACTDENSSIYMHSFAGALFVDALQLLSLIAEQPHRSVRG